MGSPAAMKRVLSGWISKRSIGIMVEDQRVAICVLASIAGARRPIYSEVHDCGDEPSQAVLERLLQPWMPKARGKASVLGPWVQVGIPDAHSFQAALPITHSNRNGTGQTFFLEAVQTTNVRAEDRIIDLLRLELNKQPLACVAASPMGQVSGLVHMMGELGARVGLLEPAASALFRAGSYHAKAPRGSTLCARFFLGAQQAVGVLGYGEQPLFWHEFALERGQETASILAAYSTLWMLARNARIPSRIDGVVVHGRPDFTWAQPPDEFQRRTGARLIRCNAPDYGPEGAALGLALADPLSDEPRIDLARELKPPPTIRDVFPWRELILHGALVGGVSLLLVGMSSDAGARLRAVEADIGSLPWVKDMDQAKLDAEKKLLEERSKAIAAFRDTRVDWSRPLRAIAASAPESTIITKLSGDAELETGSRGGPGKSKKQLVVSFEAPLADDLSVPREIEGFLTSLRGQTSLKRHFPLIEVTALRANASRQGTSPSASFSVICLPKAETSRAARPAGGASKSRPAPE